MDFKKHVLPDDLELANQLIAGAEYYTAQMNYCLRKFNLEGAQQWFQEYQRVVNDMKYLRFKKINSERGFINAKL